MKKYNVRNFLLSRFDIFRKNLDVFFVLSLVFFYLAKIINIIVDSSKYVRFYGDDYCTSSVLQSMGYWGAQLFWYKNWSGRFSYNLMVHFSESLGLSFFQILPYLLVIVLGLSFAYVFYFLFDRKAAIYSSLTLGITLSVLLVSNSPNIFQTLYWQTGSLTYTVPFIFFNIIFGIIIRNLVKNKKLGMHTSLVVVFLLALFAGGFAEAYVTLQITIITAIIALLILIFPKNIMTIIYSSVALLGSIISLVLIVLAPGNRVRQDLLPEPMGFIDLLKQTLFETNQYVSEIAGDKLFVMMIFFSLLLVFYLTIKFGREILFQKKWHPLALIGASLIFVYFAVSSVFAPGLYALSTTPPERALFLIRYPIFVAFCFGAFVFSSWWKQIFKDKEFNNSFANMLGIITILILIYGLYPSMKSYNIDIQQELKEYSVKWDYQERQIMEQKSSGKNDLNILHLDPVGELPDAQRSDKGWVNGCMSKYYKVEKIFTY